MKKIILGIAAAAFASSAAYAATQAMGCCKDCCDDMKGKTEQPAPKN